MVAPHRERSGNMCIAKLYMEPAIQNQTLSLRETRFRKDLLPAGRVEKSLERELIANHEHCFRANENRCNPVGPHSPWLSL